MCLAAWRLQKQIPRKLEEDFSSALGLVFCPWDQLDGKLPGMAASTALGLFVQVLHSFLPVLGAREGG